MKNMILTLHVIFITLSASGQTESFGDWIVSVNTGIEAHDKRLFDYPFPGPETLLAKSPEYWGTYHIGLGVKRKIWRQKRFSSFLGIGASYENATFNRPFDHTLLVTGITTTDLKVLNKYEKFSTPLSLSTFFGLGTHWLISGDVTSNFLVFKSIEEASSRGFVFSEGTFEVEDIQLRLGINYRIDKFMIGLCSRVVNFQKIDRIIFNDLIKDPRMDQNWEWNNPLRFDLTVGYTW